MIAAARVGGGDLRQLAVPKIGRFLNHLTIVELMEHSRA
jgi:hypothetical protein